MHNEVRQQLCKLIAQYGNSLSEDSRRCNALLKDHCGQYKREIFVLVNALENRVGTELINASAGVPISLLLGRLVKRLEDELGLTETAAKWAVETWALALGVIDQPIPVSVPESPKPVSPVSQTHSIPATVSVPTSSTGGRLIFPKFSVGKVKINSQEQSAAGEIDVYKEQTVELSISSDITDFSFLETCDPFKQISRLNLIGCNNFTDDKLAHLAKLTSLQFLDLSECELNGYPHSTSWENLKNLKDLLSLNLSGCTDIQDSSLEYISNITNLQSLNLSMVRGKYGLLGNIFMTDNGLKYLGKLTNLKILDLSKFRKITGPGVLEHLGHMTQLKSLDLSQCENINAARLQELKQMLPNTRITP